MPKWREEIVFNYILIFSSTREERNPLASVCNAARMVLYVIPVIVVLFAIRLYGFQNLDWRVMLCLQRIMKYIELCGCDCVEPTDEYRRLCI